MCSHSEFVNTFMSPSPMFMFIFGLKTSMFHLVPVSLYFMYGLDLSFRLFLWNLFFFCVFSKWRKASIHFVVSVCLSVRMEQLDSQGTDFDEICYLFIFRNSVEKIQVSLKSDKNNGYCT